MALESASAIVALASAVVALGVTVLGVYERNRNFRAQQAELQRQAQNWQSEFIAERGRQEVALRKEFYLEQYRYRLDSYGDVMRTLGAVSDMGPNQAELLRQDKVRLLSTADELLSHLYGKAGLLMTMRTRNRLHLARLACVAFLNDDADKDAAARLTRAFFVARRYLRADLDLTDDRAPEDLEKLVKKLATESQEEGFLDHPSGAASNLHRPPAT